MKMSDIVQHIADMLDNISDSANSADDYLHPVDDGAESGAKDVEVGVFIPPLQQKLELLKKVAGENNALSKDDELSHIKHMAGIKPIAIQIASEDNDIVG